MTQEICDEGKAEMKAVIGSGLSASDVYAIWKIRDAVFAFEQHVEDVDVDDLDLLSTTTHLWHTDDAGPTSYLRILTDSGVVQIGRVCTRKDRRKQGLASMLMAEVVAQFPNQELRLNAQAYLEQWYESLGYARCGTNFDDAGIDHLPMIRPVDS